VNRQCRRWKQRHFFISGAYVDGKHSIKIASDYFSFGTGIPRVIRINFSDLQGKPPQASEKSGRIGKPSLFLSRSVLFYSFSTHVEFWFDFGRLQYKLIIRYITESYWMPPSLADGKREQIRAPSRRQGAILNYSNSIVQRSVNFYGVLTAFPPRFHLLTMLDWRATVFLLHRSSQHTEYSAADVLHILLRDRLCGLVVRVPGYRSRGPDSIPGATRFSEK
jgi:hypothetical protein